VLSKESIPSKSPPQRRRPPSSSSPAVVVVVEAFFRRGRRSVVVGSSAKKRPIQQHAAITPSSAPITARQLVVRDGILERFPHRCILADVRDQHHGTVPVLLLQSLTEVGGGYG
jgi:hypothetical protein